jgi:hypothetical protein
LAGPGALAAAKASKAKPPKVRHENDPKLIAAARELRDKYLEQVNSPGGEMLLPRACGKYDVSRQLAPGATPMELKQTPPRNLLNAA